MTTAHTAIERSVRHNEIVELDDPSALRELKELCEEWVMTDGIVECWGSTADGQEWRVHCAAERPSSARAAHGE